MPLSTPRKAKQVDIDSPLSEDAQYVVLTLFPELEASFRQWSKEYQQERDLGALGEFVGLYRKTRKLKTVFHDGVDPSTWREPVRTIAMEVAAHALLLVKDLDTEDPEASKWQAPSKQPFIPKPAPGSVIFDQETRKYWYLNEDNQWAETCGPECDEGHTYRRECAQEQERKQELDADDPRAEF